MEVREVTKETPVMTSFKLVPAFEEGKFDFKVGQYVKMALPDGRESYFAMTNEPEDKRFVEFLVKDEPNTPACDFCRLNPGTRLEVSTPMGPGYPIEKMKEKDILLVGIGTGIAPLRSLVKSILRRPERQAGEIRLLFGVQTPAHIPFRSDFNAWKKIINLKICFSDINCPSAEYPSFMGLVTHLLPTMKFNPNRTLACVCGTQVMEKETKELLVQLGIPEASIFFNF
jgi:NAD(P)H-flavin reductase